MLVLLVLVLVAGTQINGNKAWMRVAGFSLQPSEFAKAATILMLAPLLLLAVLLKRPANSSVNSVAIVRSVSVALLLFGHNALSAATADANLPVLIQAIRDNDVSTLRRLLSQNGNPNLKPTRES